MCGDCVVRIVEGEFGLEGNVNGIYIERVGFFDGGFLEVNIVIVEYYG